MDEKVTKGGTSVEETPVISMPGSEQKAESPGNIMDVLEEESERFLKKGPSDFTFNEFENLYNSVLDVQSKGSREVAGQLLRSFPLDLEVELSNLIAWMRRKYKPYNAARLKFAIALGFTQHEETGQFFLKPKKKGLELSPALQAELKEENQRKFEELNTAFRTMGESLFKDREELFNRIPLKLFTMQRMQEAGILFPDIDNKQPFMEYCVVKDAK